MMIVGDTDISRIPHNDDILRTRIESLRVERQVCFMRSAILKVLEAPVLNKWTLDVWRRKRTVRAVLI